MTERGFIRDEAYLASVRALAATAPPLTDEQRAVLRPILSAAARRVKDARRAAQQHREDTTAEQ
jgi:uncharacterized membrane protein